MNIKTIASVIGGFFKKNAPTIMTVGGSLLTIGGTIYACKVSTDIKPVIEAEKARLDIAREQGKKELTKAYVKSSMVFAKKYAVPSVMILGGIGSMVGANCIMQNRFNALSSAYTGLASAFAGYRDRVKAAIGDDKEMDIWQNVKSVSKEVEEIDENGELKKTVKSTMIPQMNETAFDRLFDDGQNRYWSKDGRLNVAHLQAAEATANSILRGKGTLTMNELWNIVGFNQQDTDEGLYLGWKYIKDDPVYGDTHIDLGFTDTTDHAARLDSIRHSWNQGIWVSVIPPHVLIGNIVKETRRSAEERKQILDNRKELLNEGV